MTRRYLRKIRVTIGDESEAVLIDDLFVSFRIKRKATNTPASGDISIYNLNERNETRIRERGRTVTLEAGYVDAVEKIFSGDVRRVDRQRSALDRITQISIGGNLKKLNEAVFNKSYWGQVPIRDIVRDAVSEIDMSLGPIELVPDEEFEFDYKASGSAIKTLTRILVPRGVQWYEEDGTIRFTSIGKSGDDRASGIIINEQTGMIDTPTVTDDGIRVRTMLDARLKIDTKIRVETTVPEIYPDTIYKVIEVEHEGDNRAGDFATTIEARQVDSAFDQGTSPLE